MCWKLFFSFLFCSLMLPLSAQIIGTVTDIDNNPIGYANVALYSLPDSVLIAGTITNETGQFSLTNEINSDAIVKISFIGYQTQTLPARPEQQVLMQPDTTMLDELVVKGTLPQVRLRDDALVTSVQNSVLSKAGTANDVLKRLPAVTGDKGDFTVLGKGKAKIYINNRELRDESELDDLNSADIKEVEVIHNPGARYDASVKAVIRIYTLRKTGDGFSFDLRSTYLQTENTDLREQLNLNYRYKGWDIFGTLKYERYAYLQDSRIEQKTFSDTLWTQNNKLNIEGIGNILTGIVGLNYEISPTHYIGMKYTQSFFPGKNGMKSITHSDVYADGVFYDKWLSIDDNRSANIPAHRMNLYYNGSFGKLSVDLNADYFKREQSSESTITETSQEFDNRTISSENRLDNQLFASRLVLSYPVVGGKISFGNEYTNTRRDDEYMTSISMVPSSYTSIEEQNGSFFAEYSRQISFGRFTAGVRYENVRSDYFNNGMKIDEQSRNYSQWFPNFSFGTMIKDAQLQLSYTAKTARPYYHQLRSNVLYVNRFTMESGNPFLRHTVIHDATLTGSWKFIQLMMSYKHEKDAIITWAKEMEGNPAVTLVTLSNLERLPSLTAFVTASPKFGVWSPQASAGFIKQWLVINSNSKQVNMSKPMPIVSLNNSFTLPKGFILTLDTRFQGKGNSRNVYLTENQLVVNAGIGKSFLNDQLSVLLKGHDLLHKQISGVNFYNERMEVYQFNRWDTRELELTVRYKFNSGQNRYKGTGAGESEINRLR